MFYILLNTNDTPVIWLYHQLQKAGFNEIEMIVAEQLIYNKKLVVQTGGGKASYHIELADGRVINNQNSDGFINRIKYLPMEMLVSFGENDRSYVAQEQRALFNYWLASLSNVFFNACSTNGYSGYERSRLEWLMLAKKAGLPVFPAHFPAAGYSPDEDKCLHPATTAIAFRSQLFCYTTPLPENVKKNCIQLQQLSKEDLLGIDLCLVKGQWHFLSASVHPPLQYGGNEFIQHIVKMMQNGTVMRHTRRQAV